MDLFTHSSRIKFSGLIDLSEIYVMKINFFNDVFIKKSNIMILAKQRMVDIKTTLLVRYRCIF